MAKAKAKKNEAKGTICVLDEKGILVAKRDLPLASFAAYKPKPNEEVFDHVVDNAVGRYRLAGKTFVPVEDGPLERVRRAPNMEVGIMKFIAAAVAQGVVDPLPAETRDLVDWWCNTIDGVQ